MVEVDNTVLGSKSEFLIEEYRQLRLEITEYKQAGHRNERLAFGALLAIYGLIFSDSFLVNSDLKIWIWFMAPVVALVNMRRSYLLLTAMSELGDYIRENIEPFFLSQGEGWQQRLMKIETSKYSDRIRPRGVGRLWILLFVTTAFAAITKYYGLH